MLYLSLTIFKVVGGTLKETRQLKLRTSCLMFDCCGKGWGPRINTSLVYETGIKANTKWAGMYSIFCLFVGWLLFFDDGV